MPAYTALYRTHAEFARKTFEVSTQQIALQLAVEFIILREEELVFEHYIETQSLQEVTITDPDGSELANWLSPSAQLNLAAENPLVGDLPAGGLVGRGGVALGRAAD